MRAIRWCVYDSSFRYKIICRGDPGLRSLYAYDELTRSLYAGKMLAGFRTAVPGFAPTFKVTKKDTKTSAEGAMNYNIKRIPSWYAESYARGSFDTILP